MNKNASITSALIRFLGISTVLVALSSSLFGQSTSPKGQWGTVRPIGASPNQDHPNLYYNQSEIDQLRDMILVQQSPQVLVDTYNAHCFDSQGSELKAIEVTHPLTADNPIYIAKKAANPNYTLTAFKREQSQIVRKHNSYAAMSYMIHPTQAKADAIKAALYGWIQEHPNGVNGNHTFAGFNISNAWIYDLLMAYHPGTLSDTIEKPEVKNWFKLCAIAGKTLSTNRDNNPTTGGPLYNYSTGATGEDARAPLTREGKTVSRHPNWFSATLGSCLAAALVSGDQALVDFWADSGWPHDELVTDVFTSSAPPPLSANFFDLVMHIKCIYPSGANTDTYSRDALNMPNFTVNTTYSAKQSYHDAQAQYLLWAVEAAYHNGMTKVFEISDDYSQYNTPSNVFPPNLIGVYPLNTPGILRHHLMTIGVRGITETARVGKSPPDPIEHLMGWEQTTWFGHRHYDDLLVEMGALTSYNIWGNSAMWRNDYRIFMGYPRDLVYPPSGSPVRYEAETLPYTSSSGDAVTTSTTSDSQNVTNTSSNLSANAVGDFVEYTINLTEAGTYNIKVGYKSYSSRGISQLTTAGQTQGAAWNQSETPAFWKQVDLGEAVYSASGPQTFRFAVTGSSSGSHNLVFDYIELTKTGGSGSPSVLEDSYVRRGASSGENYSGENVLKLKNTVSADWDRDAVLKFDLSGLSGNVSNATLRLYMSDFTQSQASSSTVQVYKANRTSWSEDTVTADNINSSGGSVASAVVNSTVKYYEWNVTNLVNTESPGTVSFLLRSSNVDLNMIEFHSKENTNKPELVITP